jgi:predicted RecA/RadA family phage recombinase
MIPANEDARANQKNWILEEAVQHIEYLNSTMVTKKAGDAVIIGPYFGILDADILAGETGTATIWDGEAVNTSEVAVGSTFPTLHAEVWFNPTTGKYADASANNLYGVGTVISTMDANGAFSFIKRRFWVREAFYSET